MQFYNRFSYRKNNITLKHNLKGETGEVGFSYRKNNITLKR